MFKKKNQENKYFEDMEHFLPLHDHLVPLYSRNSIRKDKNYKFFKKKKNSKDLKERKQEENISDLVRTIFIFQNKDW